MTASAEQYAATIRRLDWLHEWNEEHGINDEFERTIIRLRADFVALLEQQQHAEREATGRKMQMHEYRQENEFMKNERARLQSRIKELEAAAVAASSSTATFTTDADEQAQARRIAELNAMLAASEEHTQLWEARAVRAERLLDGPELERLRRLAKQIGGPLDGRANDEYFGVRTSEFHSLRQAAEAFEAVARLGAAAPQQEPATSGDDGQDAVVSEETRPL